MSVAALIVDIVLTIAIVILVIFYFIYKNELSRCKSMPSSFCYTIHCPCDDATAGPCKGYAKRPAGDGNWYCSDAPLTKVDNNGNPVK